MVLGAAAEVFYRPKFGKKHWCFNIRVTANACICFLIFVSLFFLVDAAE